MTSSLNTRRYAIIALTVITAIVHLGLGFTTSNTLFILNGLGYLVLIVALYFIPQLAAQRALIRWVLLAYTAVTFVLYFVFNWPNIWGPAGLIDKAIELILMVLLWLDRNDP
ncbi:MAG: hypothetical protein ACK2U5_01220 [Candidatus Promineifilaceae bacterium]|jgi:hypothetical protein